MTIAKMNASFVVVAWVSIAGAKEVDMSREIRTQQVVPAPVADVWDSWTTNEGFTAFTGAPAHIQLEPGGEYTIEWLPDVPRGERESEGCRVLSYHDERMLSFSWSAPQRFPDVRAQRTTVTIYFDAEGPERTRLTLYNHGYPAKGEDEQWDAAYEYFSGAWPSVLKSCADHHAKMNDVTAIPDAQRGWMYVPSPAREGFLQNPTDEENAKVGEHFAYLQDASHSGRLILAGPCTDFEGPAVVIFHARSEDEARAFMENDPAVKAGVFESTLHPMALSLVRDRDRR